MNENQHKPGLFEKVFYNILNEDMSAGAGGVFGDGPSMGHGGAFGSSDFYAPGDARMPKILGAKKKRKSKKRKSKKRKMEEDFVQPAQGPVAPGGKSRRTFGINHEGKQIPVARRNTIERIAI